MVCIIWVRVALRFSAFGFRFSAHIITKVFHRILPFAGTVNGASGFPPVIIFCFVWQVTKRSKTKKNSVRVRDEFSTVFYFGRPWSCYILFAFHAIRTIFSNHLSRAGPENALSI